MLRDAAELLGPAVDTAIKALALTDADVAAVQLARRYARAIDDGGDLDKLGPKLFACLEALGATPAARAAIARKDRTADGKPNRLHQLRNAREA